MLSRVKTRGLMKNLLCGILCIFSFSSSAVILSPGQVVGFSDSSFRYNSSEQAQSARFCFWNEFSSICNEIKAAAQNMNGGYAGGNHDKIEILSCTLNYGDSHYGEDKAVVSYILSDDYGSEYKVKRVIKSCAVSSHL
ncbi:putative exported protein [Halobacteriovorax marinus SJ]|uniref:Exported protein n=2 Tax=Halobacteriovorax marinus TaxID=97084 RepID=E1WYA1_HALMS|nr:putative exported protein [Halobacteriovorax marinus SJ]